MPTDTDDERRSEYGQYAAEARRRRWLALVPPKASLWATPNAVYTLCVVLYVLVPPAASYPASITVGVCALVALVTPLVAVVVDGRPVVGAWLVGSAWAALLLSLLLLGHSSAWNGDDNMGMALALIFGAWTAVGYALLVVVLFAFRHFVRRRPAKPLPFKRSPPDHAA